MKRPNPWWWIGGRADRLLAGGAALLLCGCAAPRRHPLPFAEAEAALFDSLHLRQDEVIRHAARVQARAEGALAKPMAMQRYAVDLHEYEPGRRLSFTARHLYTIGARGGEYIRFDLTAVGDDETGITVDYSDRWAGIWPPFLFWSPGIRRENRIRRIIWPKEPPCEP